MGGRENGAELEAQGEMMTEEGTARNYSTSNDSAGRRVLPIKLRMDTPIHPYAVSGNGAGHGIATTQ